MKKLSLLLVLLLGALGLVGCTTATKMKVYPNYVTQKEKINKLYLLSDITSFKGKTLIVDKNRKLMDKVLSKVSEDFKANGYELVGNDMLTIGGVAPRNIVYKETKKDEKLEYLDGSPAFINENYKDTQEEIENLYISMINYDKIEEEALNKKYIKEIPEIYNKYHLDKELDAYVVAFIGIKRPTFLTRTLIQVEADIKTNISYKKAKKRRNQTGESQTYREYIPQFPTYDKITVFVIAKDGEVLWENNYLCTVEAIWTTSKYASKMVNLIPKKNSSITNTNPSSRP